MGTGALQPLIERALFPSPKPSRYNPELQNLIWIPSEHKDKIPCTFFQNPLASHLVIYCHGNAADLGTIYYETQGLASFLKVHVLAMEYSGYGLYEGTPSEGVINKDLGSVFRFATATLNIPSSRIVFYGRSLGTGPCSKVAAQLCRKKTPVGGLILQSPFTSILDAARNISSLAGLVMKNCWSNDVEIEAITCPLIIVHGKLDKVIPHKMGTELYHLCPSTKKRLLISETASHNSFHLFHDLIKPISKFIQDFVDVKENLKALAVVIPSTYVCVKAHNRLSGAVL